ncbi:hypothetical protein IQ265_12775 [Nodosilinea sp. LEGE 06152]|uniref:hypothetical protein n=1 Tax=Nodosilinea sp. LEGE 06152 TaxID=2777966 RepID=UPI00187F7D84|nr:hypothetical protein [Nodosilinea sp. LEGE 06152]MBE9157693.1 hypothetical protein [Nodosilinea sp. LEGE 06152]
MPDDFTPIPADQVYNTPEWRELRQRLSPVRKYMGHLNRGPNAPQSQPEAQPEPKPEAKTTRPKPEPKPEA